MTIAAAVPLPAERSLLIVEDDKSFLQRLARAMEGRGFAVTARHVRAKGDALRVFGGDKPSRRAEGGAVLAAKRLDWHGRGVAGLRLGQTRRQREQRGVLRTQESDEK